MTEFAIGRLRPYTWSSEASAAYEAAIEAINGVVGAYSALIADAERRPGAGQKAAEYKRLRAACQEERRRLSPEDSEGIAHVRTYYASRLRELPETGE